MEQDYLIDDGLVERLLAALADALRRTRPEPFSSPVSVAEIYQDLVPYRSVRTALGFQMNADYEHTVLRLLAGEGELARLEPEEARAELKSELEMPNPNVGLFRKFAACDVWILRTDLSLGLDAEAPAAGSAAAMRESATASRESASPPRESPARPKPDREEETRQWSGGAESLSYAARPAAPPPSPPAEPEPPDLELDLEALAEEAETVDLIADDDLMWAGPEADDEWDAAEGELLLEEEVKDRTERPDTSEQPAAAGPQEPTHERDTAVMFDSNQPRGNVAAAQATGSCGFCQASLPGGRVIRYCPFCGADQALKPCPSCREPLDPSWKFCISCGKQS